MSNQNQATEPAITIAISVFTDLAARASSHPMLSAEEHCHAFVSLLALALKDVSPGVAATLLNLIDPAQAHSAHTFELIKKALQLVDMDIETKGIVTGETVEFVRAVRAIVI